MGFALSLLYFVTNYLTPPTVFGSLAEYRVELILAVLILFVSLPKLSGSFIYKTPQSLALVGLSVGVFLSMLIGDHWAGGAVQAILAFIPNAFGFLLVCLHCNTKRKLQVLVVALAFVCMFVIAQGTNDLRHVSDSPQGADASTPYQMAMHDEQNSWFYRLRGLGLINDPNDFGQLTVCVIPLIFIFWQPKKLLQNLAFVILPGCVLLYGVYLTHSRGALLALMTLAILAARRRIGSIPALVVGALLFLASMALNFTGGRDISADAGSDRTSLWGSSMELVKSHPLFGVGINQLPNYLGLTAHNSIMVCVAELGLFGLYFWSLFLLSTARDIQTVSSPEKVSESKPIVVEIGPSPRAPKELKEMSKEEIVWMGRMVGFSLIGFLVTAWFLSRAFVMTFFVLGGAAEVVYQMAFERGMIGPRPRLKHLLPLAGGLAILLLTIMYVTILFLNFMASRG